jgi:demethylmenaquinone methyltransferase / 2-methoxy-6-polyprenyl-1,4-benzoquinol methylase
VDAVTPAAPHLVLDVATGTAGVALELARRTPAQIIGVDVSAEMVERGRQNVARSATSPQVAFVLGTAERLPFRSAAFPALTFTYLLRYVDDPAATLAEMTRVVVPGGIVAGLEFHVPPSPFWRAWWVLYTRAVLPAAGLLLGGRAWYRVGRFLGPSISTHYERYPLGWTVQAWRAAGLDDIQVRVMSVGGGLVMWGRRHG